MVECALDKRTIRVMLVDDHTVVVQGLRALLEADTGFVICAEAYDGNQVLDLIESSQPDVILMDIRMKDVGGLEATRQIKERFPDVSVIMLTVYDADIYVSEAIRAGASGYLLKDSSPELLIGGIRSVVQGGVLFSRELAFSALQARSETPGIGALTPRELDILTMMAQGNTNRAIAEQLHLAEITIKKQAQSLMRKLGVNDRTQAAVLAVQLGLIDA